MDYFHNVLTTFLGLGSVVLLSMQGQKALRFHKKYPNLCSEDEQRSLEWHEYELMTVFSFLTIMLVLAFSSGQGSMIVDLVLLRTSFHHTISLSSYLFDLIGDQQKNMYLKLKYILYKKKFIQQSDFPQTKHMKLYCVWPTPFSRCITVQFITTPLMMFTKHTQIIFKHK